MQILYMFLAFVGLSLLISFAAEFIEYMGMRVYTDIHMHRYIGINTYIIQKPTSKEPVR